MTPSSPKRVPSADIQRVLRNHAKIERLLQQCQALMHENAAAINLLADKRTSSHPGAQAALQPIPRALNPREIAIVTAVASCEAIGVYNIPRQWLAILAHVSSESGPYKLLLGILIKDGFLKKAGVGLVSISDACRGQFTADAAPLTVKEILQRFSKVFGRQDGDVISALCPAAGSDRAWMDRETLAKRTKNSAESSAFSERLRKLRKRGFIEFGPNQTVRVMLQWFSPVTSEATQ